MNDHVPNLDPECMDCEKTAAQYIVEPPTGTDEADIMLLCEDCEQRMMRQSHDGLISNPITDEDRELYSFFK